MLLKPRVFLHLLFNRGSPPRRAGEPAKKAAESETAGRNGSPVTSSITGTSAAAETIGPSATTRDIETETAAAVTAAEQGTAGVDGGAAGGETAGLAGIGLEAGTADRIAADQDAEAGAGDAPRRTGDGDQRARPDDARTLPKRFESDPDGATPASRAETVHYDLVCLFSATLLAEVAVRLASNSYVSSSLILATAARVALELGAQLATSTVLALGLLWIRGWYRPLRWGLFEPDVSGRGITADRAREVTGRGKKEDGGLEAQDGMEGKTVGSSGRDGKVGRTREMDGRRIGFLPSLIPLVLLYTALLPLLLQLGLSVWATTSSPYAPPSPSASPSSPDVDSDPTSAPLMATLSAVIPGLEKLVPDALVQTLDHFEAAWAASNKLWLGTRLLGGMSAGFGLRVLLPTPPMLTTGVVLAGWGAALGVGVLLEGLRL